MNKKQLTYFLTAYEAKSLQKAADLLYVSRQGLSKMIRSLEDELGEPLFRRTPKGLVATDFARSLVPHVRKLLDEYAMILGMNMSRGEEKSVVTIYALDHILGYLTADFLRDFQKAYPDIILSFVESVDDAAYNALLAQRADFAIATGPVDNIRFNSTPLFFSRYCLQLAANHPLAKKKAISYADLQGQKLITKGRAYRCFRNSIGTYMLLPGLSVDILAETADADVTLDLVANGDAVSVTYDYIAIMHQRENVVLRPFDSEVQGQEIYLLSLKDVIPSKAGRCFQQFLTDWLPAHHKDEICWPEESES